MNRDANVLQANGPSAPARTPSRRCPENRTQTPAPTCGGRRGGVTLINAINTDASFSPAGAVATGGAWASALNIVRFVVATSVAAGCAERLKS